MTVVLGEPIVPIVVPEPPCTTHHHHPRHHHPDFALIHANFDSTLLLIPQLVWSMLVTEHLVSVMTRAKGPYTTVHSLARTGISRSSKWEYTEEMFRILTKMVLIYVRLDRTVMLAATDMRLSHRHFHHLLFHSHLPHRLPPPPHLHHHLPLHHPPYPLHHLHLHILMNIGNKTKCLLPPQM